MGPVEVPVAEVAAFALSPMAELIPTPTAKQTRKSERKNATGCWIRNLRMNLIRPPSDVRQACQALLVAGW
jgi:hypothetical protein